MKGPSLEAIRKFKQNQEQRKREEDEKRVQEKLSTLEHRALQGDKKAKTQLKQIEKLKEEKNKTCDVQSQQIGHHDMRSAQRRNGLSYPSQEQPRAKIGGERKHKKQESDFEELMALAKKNNNEIRQEPKPQPMLKIKKKERDLSEINVTRPAKPIIPDTKPPICHNSRSLQPSRSEVSSQSQSISRSSQSRQELRPQGSVSINNRNPKRIELQPQDKYRPRNPVIMTSRGRPEPASSIRLPYRRSNYYDDDDDEEEEEDAYEDDGFVVSETDEAAQDELHRTLRSVFNYDKRRCDLREQELDRQYRAIGRVSTFEDLEREERRASRLAAAEDARAMREEEERKRLKKLRMKGYKE